VDLMHDGRVESRGHYDVQCLRPQANYGPHRTHTSKGENRYAVVSIVVMQKYGTSPAYPSLRRLVIQRTSAEGLVTCSHFSRLVGVLT